ncbi:MAG: hypothetical protein CVU18_16565 [Betaproteobacteria bacterium HGW-Betaproteobacteria-12]|nr:MAG: hypothetical protein CVU18_16565 [Betaproteobacteria bacterium HGW-Betaproteobacteria-12]
MELTRLAIVYIHLIACCIAIGLVITSDVAMLKKLVTGDPDSADDIAHLHYVKQVVVLSLVALWISGLAIVGLDASVKGLEYFTNPKLQAKFAIVTLLTLNGFILHGKVMPAIEKFGSLLKLPSGLRQWSILAGAVSAVSWLYAALIGVGRPLAWKYSLVELLAAYPVLIVGGMLTTAVLVHRAKQRSSYLKFRFLAA